MNFVLCASIFVLGTTRAAKASQLKEGRLNAEQSTKNKE